MLQQLIARTAAFTQRLAATARQTQHLAPPPRRILLGLPLLPALLLAASPIAADTLDDVKTRGELRCGVNGEAPGLSQKYKRRCHLQVAR